MTNYFSFAGIRVLQKFRNSDGNSDWNSIKKYLGISKFINVAFFASPDLKIAFDLRGEKIITGNKIQDSRTWKSGSKYSALLRGGAEGGFSPTPLNYGDQKREQIEKKDNLLLLFFVWGPRICPS